MNLPTFLRGRVALVAAHPDDETVSAGACIAQLSELAIIHITDGAPRNMQDALSHGFASRGEYAAARRQEFLAALCVGRVTPFETAAFDVADQEASFHLAAISRDLARLFEQMAIETVLVHPYEGGHPDHDATAFAVHMAARLRGSGAPKIAEFTSYHLRDGEIETGVFLPAEESGEVACPLNDEERERKRRMLECFRSQQATLGLFEISCERFRPAPAYNFALPPHPGSLFFDRFPWGMTGSRWLSLAQAAQEELELC